MTPSTQAISPLRQRMIDDMRMRKLSPKTQSHYLRAVRQFAGYLGRSPDTATVEDLRRYQLHLVDHGTSPISLNAAITGLKFFYDDNIVVVGDLIERSGHTREKQGFAGSACAQRFGRCVLPGLGE